MFKKRLINELNKLEGISYEIIQDKVINIYEIFSEFNPETSNSKYDFSLPKIKIEDDERQVFSQLCKIKNGGIIDLYSGHNKIRIIITSSLAVVLYKNTDDCIGLKNKLMDLIKEKYTFIDKHKSYSFVLYPMLAFTAIISLFLVLQNSPYIGLFLISLMITLLLLINYLNRIKVIGIEVFRPYPDSPAIDRDSRTYSNNIRYLAEGNLRCFYLLIIERAIIRILRPPHKLSGLYIIDKPLSNARITDCYIELIGDNEEQYKTLKWHENQLLFYSILTLCLSIPIAFISIWLMRLTIG